MGFNPKSAKARQKGELRRRGAPEVSPKFAFGLRPVEAKGVELDV